MARPKTVSDQTILDLLPATVRELRDRGIQLDPYTIRWRLRQLGAVRQRRSTTGNWGAHGAAADLWWPPGTRIPWTTDTTKTRP